MKEKSRGARAESAVSQPSVELHIEELVLHGFPRSDRYRIAEAVELELSRLVTRVGLSPSLKQEATVDRVRGGSFQVAPGARAEATGRQIARAVFGGLPR